MEDHMTKLHRVPLPLTFSGLLVACLGVALVVHAQDLARPAGELAAGDVDAVLRRAELGLKDSDPRARRRALEELGRLGPLDERAGAILLLAIKDEDNLVSSSAAAVLRAIHSTKMLSMLLAALSEKDPKTRSAVVSALGGFRDAPEKVVPPLQAVLQDKDELIRVRAVQSLGSIGTSQVHKIVQGAPGEAMMVPAQEIAPGAKLVLEPLLRALHDDSRQVRDASVQALCGVGPPAVAALVKVLDDPDANTRSCAVWALRGMRPFPAEAANAMIKLLSDPDREVRRLAIWSIPVLGPEATLAIKPLLEAMRGADDNCRQEAAMALARIGRAAVPRLIVTLKADDDPKVRASAALALGQMTPIPPAAMPHLIAALRDKHERVRGTAAYGVAAFGPKAENAVPALLEMIATDSHSPAAIRALGAVGPASKAALPSLLDILKDRKNNAEVRAAAADALLRIDPRHERLVAVFVQGLEQHGANDLWVTNRCELALSRLGAAATPALTAALADPQYKARSRVIAILGRRGSAPDEIIPVFAKALKDEDPAVRKQAGVELGQMGLRGLGTLMAAAKSDDSRARAAALAGLRIITPRTAEVNKALLTALQDADADVRSAGVEAIGAGSMAAELVPSLVAQVQSDKFREAAIATLGQIGPSAKDAVPALVAVLRSADVPARKASAAALVRIGEPASTALVALLRDPDASIRRVAAESLDRILIIGGRIPGPAAQSAIAPLVAALQSADPQFADAAVDILLRIGNDALSELLKAPRDKSGRFSPRIAFVLEGIAPTTDGLVPALVAALRDKDVDVRMNAIRALARVRERALPELIATLKDPDAETRHLCGASLSMMGPAAKPAGPALVELLKSETDHVWAGEFLLQIDPKAAAAAGVAKAE
jgi:HEAT repeat protein